MSAGPCLRTWLGTWLAGLVVLVGGYSYRVTVAAIGAELSVMIRLPQPLSSLPLTIGPWEATDVPISEGVQKIAMNDDFVNRRYRNRQTGETVNLYVAYTARPRTMLRHRPTVCYPSAGWSHLGTRTVEIPLEMPEARTSAPLSSSHQNVAVASADLGTRDKPALAPEGRVGRGARTATAGAPDVTPLRSREGVAGAAGVGAGFEAKLPALLHAFLQVNATSEARVVVLNYYVLNGELTVDENSFWGLRGRDPNFGRNAGHYVAQVQVMVPVLGSLEAAERLATEFTRLSAPEILELLPASSGATGSV